MKLPTTENKVKELTNKLLETHEFPQCIGTIDDADVGIVEQNEHYADYINGKGFFLQRSSCVRLKILPSKRNDEIARKCA